MLTPAAIGQMRADTDAVLARFDAGLHRVLTRYPEPIPTGEATESDFGALLEAVQADPLRAHFEDDHHNPHQGAPL